MIASSRQLNFLIVPEFSLAQISDVAPKKHLRCKGLGEILNFCYILAVELFIFLGTAFRENEFRVIKPNQVILIIENLIENSIK